MRAHIPYLDSESLQWEEVLNTGAYRKVLGVDPDTGSETTFMRLKPGWHGPAGAHYHSGYEEALVLSGDVDLNGNDLLVDWSYLYRPGGIVHGWVDASPSGSDIVIKMGTATDLVSVGEREHDYEYDYKDKRVDDGRPHIVHLRTQEQSWEPWPGGPAGAHKRSMSLDVKTGAETSLLKLDQGFQGELTLAPDRTWEWVVVEGGMTLADGTQFGMIDYSHRPAGSGETVIAEAPSGCTLMVWDEP